MTFRPDSLAQVKLVLIAMSLPFFFLAALYRERRDVEQALRVEHQRYGLATSAGGVGVWDWNLDTGDIYVDPLLNESSATRTTKSRIGSTTGANMCTRTTCRR